MNTRRTALLVSLTIGACLGASVLHTAPANASGIEDIPDGTSAQKVMLIDADGVRWDKLKAAHTPNIDALAATGQIGPGYVHGTDVARTDSGPGHSTILTGVWPDKHKVVNNTFAGNDLASYPDLLTRLETQRPELSTFSILDWEPLNTHVIGTPDVKMQQTADGGSVASDRRTTDTVTQALAEQDADVNYVYLHQADSMGHTYGADSPDYTTAIETIDTLVGELVDAVHNRQTYQDEDWLFLLTTDHGFDGTEHGTNGHRTREIFTLAAGGDIPVTGQATRQWRQVDILPTVFAHLGVPIDPSWGLDGIPIGTPSSDPFDTLSGQLGGVVDEAPKPDELLGWTETAPNGWQITENTPEVGVTEYRGWSFMTGQFWATSAPNQGRESFFRGRDVIAVADCDEWDDKGAPSTDGFRLDSTLKSPWRAVVPGQVVQISYGSHYRQVARATDPQNAELVIYYDNGTQKVLWSQDVSEGDSFEISRLESFNTRIPRGVKQFKVGWRMYNAANNYYWAIDNPQITLV